MDSAALVLLLVECKLFEYVESLWAIVGCALLSRLFRCRPYYLLMPAATIDVAWARSAGSILSNVL